MKLTETEIEPLLVETLRVKAMEVSDIVEPFDPSTTIMDVDDHPRRSRHLVAAAALVVVFVGLAGLVFALRGDERAPIASREAQVPVAHLSIEALPELRFQAKTYTTAPGLNEIDFTSAGGSHVLAFDDPALVDVRLFATEESPSHAEVRLEAGRDYTIYCAMPGHRDTNEEAVIHVTSGSGNGDSVDEGP